MAFALAALGIVPVAAQTESSVSSESRPSAQEIGAHTRGILDIQRTGAQAGALQVLHGELAALSYQRYRASFLYPIPQFYSGQAGAQSGSGSSMAPGAATR